MTKKHILLMLACCLIPIGLIAVSSALAIPVSGLISVVAALICPLMMLFMMFGLHGHHAAHQASVPVEKKP